MADYARMRHCLVCNALVRRDSRCARCKPRRAEIYGIGHQTYRLALLVALRANGGGSCPICDKPLPLTGRGVELDHEIPVVDGWGTGPRRLVHAHCNSSRGGERGTTFTPGNSQ